VVPETPPGERTNWIQILSSVGQLLVSTVTLAILAKQVL
jgi:hypothetical protein